MNTRFAIFADGSNLYGSLSRTLGVEVTDYERLFRRIFSDCANTWKTSSILGQEPTCQLTRVYWYVIGAIDEWDIKNPRTEASLHSLFEGRDASDLRSGYLARASASNPDLTTAQAQQKAFSLCMSDFEGWYSRQNERLRRMRSFYCAVRNRTDLLDIIECGRWKIDFLSRRVIEKGLDTQLAVDMLDLIDTYDIAIVVSGDADSIPSIRYAKRQGKQVIAVEFRDDRQSSLYSSQLKTTADIVIQLRHSDLIHESFVRKREQNTSAAGGFE